MHCRRLLLYALAALGCASTAASALAQSSYPDHLVKVVVALPAGGSVDIVARLVAEKLVAALEAGATPQDTARILPPEKW